MTEPAPYTEDDVALVAAATEQHYIVAGRTDAMGNSPCVCDQWNDAAGDNPGWDQHMAEVTLAALANAGRLLPEDTRTVAALVNEFHRRPGVDCVQPTHPTVDVPGALDRVAYVEEEARELREAVETGDVVGSADALADLAYVVYGAAWRFGIPLDAVVAEVHRSNMTKTATPGDGKAVKGPGYSPPDVARVLGVPATDMSTAPNTSVGAHFEAHSAHTPAVPEGAEPPCGLPPGLCGDDEDCRLPPCQPASVVPGEEQA